MRSHCARNTPLLMHGQIPPRLQDVEVLLGKRLTGERVAGSIFGLARVGGDGTVSLERVQDGVGGSVAVAVAIALVVVVMGQIGVVLGVHVLLGRLLAFRARRVVGVRSAISHGGS